MKTLLTPILLLLLAPLGWGQVSVTLKMDRKQYLVHEPVSAVVTITNRSGRELDFASEMQGRIALSWLNFSMRDAQGRSVPKRHHKVFQRAIIPAGRSMARRVNLSEMFGISQMGNYSVTAQVRPPASGGSAYGSNSGQFTVGGGTEIEEIPFGVPDSPVTKRAYRVVSFNDGHRTSIYAQVMNSLSDRALATIRLSEFLTFVPPQVALDGKNQLHVLYLGSPEIFVETTVSQDGQLLNTQYFKRADGRKPRYVAFSDGRLAVSGAIPYDPKKEAAEAPRARRASERPK